MFVYADGLFVEHKSRNGENRDFHSVSLLDMGGFYRNFNFVGNLEDFDNLKQNDSCSIILKLRFGKEKEAYIVKGVDVVSIKKK